MKTLLAVAAAVALAGCAGETVPHEQVVSGEDENLSSCALIELAVSQGRLDYGTGLLYKVYSIYEPESLPEEFRSDGPSKCGSPVVVEVQRNWHRLSPGQQAEIEFYIQPLQDDDETGTDLDDVGPNRPEHGRGELD
ncbi:MAG: hypothetical protein GF405_03810 [Candidatus Eisenbacteria bacterium]|nr:hypothetical protein [Candidatus Eisenbacteria bacterium]